MEFRHALKGRVRQQHRGLTTAESPIAIGDLPASGDYISYNDLILLTSKIQHLDLR